jgi:hypothetical protein
VKPEQASKVKERMPTRLNNGEGSMRIPIEAGQGFRREAGHHSGLKPATRQGRLRVPVRVSN